MQISSKQYAAALYEAVKEKKDSEIKDVIKNFVKILVNNNVLSIANNVVGHFTEIWNKSNKIVEAEITSARELDKPVVKLLHNYIAKRAGVKNATATQKIDKKLLGGVIIRYDDKVLDDSLKTRLGELREKMVK